MSDTGSIKSSLSTTSSTFASVHPSSGTKGGSGGGGNNGDLPFKIRKGVGRLSENMHILANEPSLAFFCLQEHIRKEVPTMIKERSEFSNHHRTLQGTCYDIDYNIGAVKSMEKSTEQFNSIQNHLRNALFLKQQLKHEESRRKQLERQETIGRKT